MDPLQRFHRSIRKAIERYEDRCYNEEMEFVLQDEAQRLREERAEQEESQ